MWGYLRLRWGLSETSKNTTPPRAPNGTKKANKKVCVEIHSWKMVWQNCPVSWKFWFPEVISLTMGYCSIQITPYNCTWKPFSVAKPEPQSCSASAFPYFEAKAEIGVISKQTFQFRHLWKTVWQGVLLLLGWGVSPGKIYSGTSPAVLLAPSKTEDTSSPSSPLAWHALTLRERWHLIRVELLSARLKYKLTTLWLLNVEEIEAFFCPTSLSPPN